MPSAMITPTELTPINTVGNKRKVPTKPVLQIPVQVYDRGTLIALLRSPLALKSCPDPARLSQFEPIRNSAPPEQTIATIAAMVREDFEKEAQSATSIASSLVGRVNDPVVYASVPDLSLNPHASSFAPGSSIPITVSKADWETGAGDQKSAVQPMDSSAKTQYGSPAILPMPGVDRPFHVLPAKPTLCALQPSIAKVTDVGEGNQHSSTLPFVLALGGQKRESIQGFSMSPPNAGMWAVRRQSAVEGGVPIDRTSTAANLAASFQAFSFNGTTGPSPPRIPGSISQSQGSYGGAVRVPRRPSAASAYEVAANGGGLLGAVPMQGCVYPGERRQSYVAGQHGNGNGLLVEVEATNKSTIASSWRRDSQNVFG